MGTTLPEADSRLKRTFSNSNRAKQLQERNTSSNGKMSAWIFLGCLLWQRLGRGTGSTPGACSGQGGRIWGHLAVRGNGFGITLLPGGKDLRSPCCKGEMIWDRLAARSSCWDNGNRASGNWPRSPGTIQELNLKPLPLPPNNALRNFHKSQGCPDFHL